jgi:hypothetical protein
MPWKLVWEYRLSPPFLTLARDGGEWSASRPCRFTPKVKALGTHWIGGWAGTRAGLGPVQKRKKIHWRESNPSRHFCSPLFYNSNSGWWSPTVSTRHCGHQEAYCANPGWLWWWRNWWNDDWQGKSKYSEKTCHSAALSSTNPTCLPGPEPTPPRWEASD